MYIDAEKKSSEANSVLKKKLSAWRKAIYEQDKISIAKRNLSFFLVKNGGCLSNQYNDFLTLSQYASQNTTENWIHCYKQHQIALKNYNKYLNQFIKITILGISFHPFFLKEQF